jgi:hypothetical protein
MVGAADYNENSSATIIWLSRSIRSFFTSEFNLSFEIKLIILLKLGLIGYSNLAAIRMLVQARSGRSGGSSPDRLNTDR